MRDFTQRLVVDHGLRPTKIAWLEAWDMRTEAPHGLWLAACDVGVAHGA